MGLVFSLENALWALGSLVAGLLISHYYFKRSIAKSLSINTLVDAAVFDGITDDVKRQLQFKFRDIEVTDLHQTVLLIRNSGDRAISNVIQPLAFELPKDAEFLDASIIHRHPRELSATVRTMTTVRTDGDATVELILDFPLLNRGEFFVVKLLMNGDVNVRALSASISAEDLPRTLKIDDASLALNESQSSLADNLIMSIVGTVGLFWLGGVLKLVGGAYPRYAVWSSGEFEFSLATFGFILPAGFGALLCAGLAVAGIASVFTGRNNPKRVHIPPEIREMLRNPLHRRNDRTLEKDLKQLSDVVRGIHNATVDASPPRDKQ